MVVMPMRFANSGLKAQEYSGPILGLIFLRWTTIMYVMVSPGGVTGLFEWGFLIFALVVDIGAYAGGGFGNKDRIPGTA